MLKIVLKKEINLKLLTKFTNSLILMNWLIGSNEKTGESIVALFGRRYLVNHNNE